MFSVKPPTNLALWSLNTTPIAAVKGLPNVEPPMYALIQLAAGGFQRTSTILLTYLGFPATLNA